MNPFWIAGTALALWALVLAFGLGLRRESFPRSDSEYKAVITISAVLTVAPIAAAIYGGVSGAGADKGVRKGPEKADAKTP